MEELLSVGEVAKALGVDRYRVAYLVDIGRITPACVVGGRRLLRRDQVAAVATALAAPRRGARRRPEAGAGERKP